MKSVLFLLSLVALTARRSVYAFAPKVPVCAAAAKSTFESQAKQDQSSTALEAYAMGGYTNGNNLMYRSGGYGRYSGGYGGYGYDRPYASSYSLMPDETRRGYGGYYDRQYYNSPYRYGSGYSGYNDRFDMNRRYFNNWNDRRYDSPYSSGYSNGYGYNRLES